MDNLVIVFDFIDDGVEMMALVLKQWICLCRIDFCRKMYMMKF